MDLVKTHSKSASDFHFWLGPPARCQLLPILFGGRAPLLNRLQKKSWYPCSNLSTGAPSWGWWPVVGGQFSGESQVPGLVWLPIRLNLGH